LHSADYFTFFSYSYGGIEIFRDIHCSLLLEQTLRVTARHQSKHRFKAI
jgi:hypothetical protein